MRIRMIRKAVLLLGAVFASFALGGCTMLSEGGVRGGGGAFGGRGEEMCAVACPACGVEEGAEA